MDHRRHHSDHEPNGIEVDSLGRGDLAMPSARGAGPASVRPDHNKFDPCLCTRDGTSANCIAIAVRSALDAAISRKRQRRPRDAVIFTGLIDAIVANLVDNHLKSSSDPASSMRWISISLSGRHLRKDSVLFPTSQVPLSSLPERLREMESLGFVIVERAPQHENADWVSRMRSGPALAELIAEHKPKLQEFTRWHSGGPGGLIELRERDAASASREHHRVSKVASQSRVVPFAETPQTRHWTAQVAEINAALAQADMIFDASAIDITVRPELRIFVEHGIALHDRRLRRIFHTDGRVAFDHGGRLYGGFWQRIPRELRPGIRISGEPLVSLDFKAMFVQLLYAVKARQQPPIDGDPYAGIDPVNGWPRDSERAAKMRDAVKRNLSAVLFASGKRRVALVRGTKAALSRGLTADAFMQAAARRHPAIAPWFGTEVGFELMFHESEIMIATLLRCLGQGFVVLPLHDGLLVGESNATVAREAMGEEFARYTGGFAVQIEG